MSISILNYESDVVDDFEGVEELVCLASGDIYDNDDPFGTYVAMWRVDAPDVVNILITPFHKFGGNDDLRPALTIGLQYSSDSKLEVVDPSRLPWGDADDGVCFGKFIKPDEIKHYFLASKAAKIAADIVELDETIRAIPSL